MTENLSNRDAIDKLKETVDKIELAGKAKSIYNTLLF